MGRVWEVVSVGRLISDVLVLVFQKKKEKKPTASENRINSIALPSADDIITSSKKEV